MHELIGNLIPPDRITISQEVGLHKPTPFIFTMAVQAVDLEPEECLFVGDSLNADAIGAVQQGGFRLGLWLDREGTGADVALPPGVVRITSLAEVFDFI
jgi:putative hydrolase of the HAD superfamily